MKHRDMFVAKNLHNRRSRIFAQIHDNLNTNVFRIRDFLFNFSDSYQFHNSMLVQIHFKMNDKFNSSMIGHHGNKC